VNAFQTNYGGAKANAFVAKLNNTGSALLYSSFMGGRSASLQDVGVAIKVDSAGNAFLTGRTETFPDIFTGTRFPIVNAFQEKHAGGVSDAFVMKLTPQGTIAYSSYLGGTGGDNGNGIALSEGGQVYVVGTTSSQDFPTKAAYQPGSGGGGSCNLGNCLDAFVAIISNVTTGNTALKINFDRFAASISWPGTNPNLVLEWTTSFTPPVIWTPETTRPTDTATERHVPAPLTGRSRFYRLRSLQ
jgi:hypothetical protein